MTDQYERPAWFVPRERHYCIFCGNEIKTNARQKFCSDKCYKEYYRLQRVGKDLPDAKPVLPPEQQPLRKINRCGFCLKETLKDEYCSERCERLAANAPKINKGKSYIEYLQEKGLRTAPSFGDRDF